MQLFQSILHQPIPVLIGAVLGWNLLFFGGLGIWASRKAPKFPPEEAVEVIFKERGASGKSGRGVLISRGGAARCLTVVVTRDELWTRTHPFFLGGAVLHDLVFRVPLAEVTSAMKRENRVEVEFRRADGSPVKLSLLLRNPEAFLRSLGKA